MKLLTFINLRHRTTREIHEITLTLECEEGFAAAVAASWACQIRTLIQQAIAEPDPISDYEILHVRCAPSRESVTASLN